MRPRPRRVNRTPHAGAGVAAAGAVAARGRVPGEDVAAAGSPTDAPSSVGSATPTARRRPLATRRRHRERRHGFDGPDGSATSEATPATTTGRTPSSEARRRRAAVRRRHQRRRRAARALRRRAPRAARAGRGPDDVRARLRHVAQRVSRPASSRSTACRCAAFPVDHERDVKIFAPAGRDRVFEQPHSYLDELTWLDGEGPTSSALHRLHQRPRKPTTTTSSSSAIATTTRITARGAVPEKAILVPTAERDDAIGAGDLPPDVPRRPCAHVQQSRRARADPGRHRTTTTCPAWWSASDPRFPSGPKPRAVPPEVRHHGPLRALRRPHRQNKGCKELFAFFLSAARRCRRGLRLVLIGKAILPIPDASAHPPPRLSRRRRTSSTRWRLPTC